MSRDVEVYDIQRAISDIRAWSNGSAHLPEPKADLLKATADLLESLLVHREDIAYAKAEACTPTAAAR